MNNPYNYTRRELRDSLEKMAEKGSNGTAQERNAILLQTANMLDRDIVRISSDRNIIDGLRYMNQQLADENLKLKGKSSENDDNA